ncbi:PAS domain S-box protein [Virgibacillus sp. DJP39]|uniref:PAS domain S-box protein n=1 Tax=Virgibacillus sp. DJP39 TaxID=3409790 RepID=UPI003BB4EFCD
MKTSLSEDLRVSMENEKMYSQIIEYSLESILIHANEEILYVNESGAKNLKGTKEEIIGSSIVDCFQGNSKNLIRERIRLTQEEGIPAELIEETIVRADGSSAEVELYCHPIDFGDKQAIQTTLRDITKRKEEERQHKRQVNELSTPIVPLLEDISVLPLIGSIDLERAIQLLDKIPSEVQQKNVQILIIDFSGIYTFDEMITDYILKISNVLQLLGVRSIITGIRPDLTQSAVKLGVDLTAIKTMATVQQALEYLGVSRITD